MKGMTLEHADVVFMYVPSDTSVYAKYGATMSAWGGAHTLGKVRELVELGVHPTGTMWCLTAGARDLHENSDLREATVRDIEGKPIAVPWLPDHVYEGTPSWWGCGNHPAFRAHMRKKVCEAMAGGAWGLHVDDHLSTAHPAIFAGGCFCSCCMDGFRQHLIENCTPEMMDEAGVAGFEGFDYLAFVRQYAENREDYLKIQERVPLHREFVDWQLRRAAANLKQLGALAAEVVNRPITLSANTGLPYLPHTVAVPNLTHIVGEVDHHAAEGTRNLIGAVKAYRMAEALGKPMAATASGWDWAYVRENGLRRLVCLWIALSYACGQRLMVPHHMWCFTPEKGTHWYDGPTDAYAPLYQFVRGHQNLFNEMETLGPLMPPGGLPDNFDTEVKRQLLKSALDAGEPRPLTPNQETDDVWIFPRASAQGAVLHCVNLDYDLHSDAINPKRDLSVRVPEGIMGRGFNRAVVHSYDGEPMEAAVSKTPYGISLTIPELKLWSLVELKG